MLESIALLTLGAFAAPAPITPDEPDWYADFDKAAAVAEKEGKDLLVDFTGSDWCGWCIKLHNEVFEHAEFYEPIQENYVLVALDFPRGEEAKAKVPNPERNVELRDKYGVRGYPTVFVMTPDGEAYGRTGYKPGGPEAYVEHIAELRKERPASAPKTLDVGSTVPESIALTGLDGKKVSFADLRGKVVMVHFWSSTCPYEIHADPIFAAMDRRFQNSEDVVMVGINANHTEIGEAQPKDGEESEAYAKLEKKIAEVGYTHPMLLDHQNRVADMFQALSTPHCFVIDREGVIQYAGALDDDPRGKKGEAATNYVSDAIAAVLKGEKPATQSTKPYGCSIKRVAKEGSAEKGPKDGKRGKKRKAEKKAKKEKKEGIGA